jgi:hypothetical protein
MKFQNVIKLTYFCFVFSLFLAKHHSKKICKQQISTKLDKGFRLVYKLSYLDEDKFWSIFAHKGTLTKKKSKFFSQQDMTIYTPIESPCRV